MSASTTLTSEPVTGVLQRLLTDAARTRADHRRRQTQRGPGPAAPDSAESWEELRDVHFAVAPETGRLLYVLARSGHARSVVEFGTSFGVSTLYLAAAVRDNGGGRVIGTEFVATKAARARDTLAAAALDDLVEIRVGDALETLRANVPAAVDLVLLDGTKTLYLDVLQLLEPRLATGSVVVADNAARAPEYLDHVRDVGGYLSVPGPAGDVEISLRLGP